MEKLTGRQEAFAQAVARGATASDAYRGVYRPKAMKSKSVHEKASHLMGIGKVRARVDELRGRVMEKVVQEIAVNKAWITTRLVQNVERGMANGILSAAIRALELLGKDLGMFMNREMAVKDPLDALTTVELRQLLELLEQPDRSCADRSPS